MSDQASAPFRPLVTKVRFGNAISAKLSDVPDRRSKASGTSPRPTKNFGTSRIRPFPAANGRANGPNPYQPGAKPQVPNEKGMRAESPPYPPRFKRPSRPPRTHRRNVRAANQSSMARAFSPLSFVHGILGLRPRLVWFAPLALKSISATLRFEMRPRSRSLRQAREAGAWTQF